MAKPKIEIVEISKSAVSKTAAEVARNPPRLEIKKLD
jgi:hypothetical protein